MDQPSKVAILDWQLAMLQNPAFDLSYFIYACGSKEIFHKLDDLLKFYHDEFSNFLKQLGSQPEKIYTYKQLLEDWKIFSSFGIILSPTVYKITSSEETSEELFEKGGDLNDNFVSEPKNNKIFKHRTQILIEHVIERNFI